MARGRDLPVEVRNLIVHHRKEGKSLAEIADIVKKSRATVQKIIERYNLRGNTATVRRSGRPRAMTDTEVRKIVRQVRKTPRSSAVQIAQDLSHERGNPVSASTIRRALNASGLHGRVPRKKPCISNANRLKRLTFAKNHLNTAQTFWDNVIFSDESKFEIFGSKRRNKVWRSSNSELLPQNLTATVKHGGGSVMVWGCMSAAGTGNLVFIESTMNSKDYLAILQNNLLPSVQKLGLTSPWVFQQDNDPKHTAKIVKEWLLYRTPKQLNSPPQSPDLNPIEHLWEVLDRNIRKRPITSKQGLRAALTEEWAKISPDVTKNLVSSVPRRLAAVIKARGGPTKY